MAKKRNTHLMLIDASNLIYRSHHAFVKHGLTAPDGTHTGAVYGTMNGLKHILNLNPTHIAFVMDARGKNFRHKLFPEYKAGRPKMPVELRPQIKLIRKFARYMGITVVRKKGHEADDIIGTLAKRGRAAGCFVTIHSGDKDFLQLVGSRIVVLNPSKGRTMNTSAVKKVYGISPSQFVDYLAMTGDKVDNIPGIAGIGDKTATQLLQKWGSLAKVIGHAGAIGGAVGQRIKDQRVTALLSHQLATINTEVKGLPKIEELKRKKPKEDLLAKLKKELGFKAGTGQSIRKKKQNEGFTPTKSLF